MGRSPRTLAAVAVLFAFVGVTAVAGFKDMAVKTIPGHATTYQVAKEGRGNREVKPGDEITVMATGLLKAGNKKFWSTADANEYPFTFEVGSGRVITGWDVGVRGMREGELRRISIPAGEAYGDKGDEEWKIPPNADLVFVIECQKIKAGRAGKGPTVH